MNRILRSVFAIFISISSIANAVDSEPSKLLAGAATSNITPELGIDIVGGFVPFPATHVHDELHARCLVLDDGTTKLALVVCDLLGIHRSVTLEARQLIEKATGIPASNVMISATHTHSAGNAIGAAPRGFYSDHEPTDYQRFVAHRIADGVQRAMNLRRPAEIAFGTAEAPEHVFNRRWIMKPGTVPVTPFGVTTDKVKMNPGSGDPNLVEPAGPTDPTVSFIALREPAGRLISVFSAYSLHYVGNVGEGHISADYYGMYCEALKKLQQSSDSDPPFVAMMANGTSGDINNINFRTPRPRTPPYTQMRIVAEDVARKVHSAIANLTWKDHASLDARYRELGIAWRKVEPELLEWAKEEEAKAKRLQSKEDQTSVYAGRVQRLANASPETKAPVQVLRIGDVCIGTSPCETFAETGLEFKKRSPIKRSFMVELANGYYGYLPPPRHFELGGYETWPGTNYLERQASVMIMDALLEMTGELNQKVILKTSDTGMSVEIDGEVFTEYIIKDVARPYMYPLIGPAGTNVSREFPMKKDVPGEALFRDHPHHRSLWFGHSRINEINFWAEYQVFGKQVHTGFTEVQASDNQARFTASTQWIGPDNKVVMTDERRITIAALPDGEKTLDFDITLKATEGDVVIGDTKEGTMALRLCPSLSINSSKSGVSTGPSTGHAFNSNGVHDQDIWGKHANWVCYYGPDPKGNAVGVVIFSHPSNLRSPTTWHARDYGLFAVNPFGLHDFEPDKLEGAGDYTIKNGEVLTLRYRFYLAKGQPTRETLDERFHDYAKEKIIKPSKL